MNNTQFDHVKQLQLDMFNSHDNYQVQINELEKRIFVLNKNTNKSIILTLELMTGSWVTLTHIGQRYNMHKYKISSFIFDNIGHN